MAWQIFRRGNRLFAAGSIGLIVVALLHGIGNYAPPPADAALNVVLEAMRGYQIDLEGLACDRASWTSTRV
jgi:hypothetical protein